MIRRIQRNERGVSEFDTTDLPIGDKKVEWWHFNADIYGTDRSYTEISNIALENENQRLDLRPYLITSPFICFSTDKMQKCLDIFRANWLR